MRTHFPGALHEVRSAARFPLGFEGAWIPDEWRASASAAAGDCANGKAKMGSQFATVLLTQFLTNRKGRSKPWQPKRSARSYTGPRMLE